jgi:adenine-specific DNA-methyltransferase
LWELLRRRQVGGAKFRRQQPLGPVIVDFYCEQARLVVEADGAQHRPPPADDIDRDAFFESAGLRVLRFSNEEILQRPDSVVARIRDALLPSPLGRGAGGEGSLWRTEGFRRKPQKTSGHLGCVFKEGLAPARVKKSTVLRHWPEPLLG